MMQAVFHQFPQAQVRFRFKNRTSDLVKGPCEFTYEMVKEIMKEIKNLELLGLTVDEYNFLKRELPFLTPDFLDFLTNFKFDSKYIHFSYDELNNELNLIIEGPWLQTILFEVPVLAIINEVFFKHYTKDFENTSLFNRLDKLNDDTGQYIIHKKEHPHNHMKFTDFGTRRRFSRDWQQSVLENWNNIGALNGTSNLYFAMQLGLKPIGTMAHEWIQAGQAFTHPRDSQKFMLDKWVEEYQGDLGTALSDTMGFQYFLKDYNRRLIKLYDGVRLDSGDPVQQTHRLIEHYEAHGIDPRQKLVVFSDGLNIRKAIDLFMAFNEQINVAFGIGTSITNNCPKIGALQIVIKMTHCNGLDVAKISDTPAKTMCENDTYIKYLYDLIKKELN